MRFSLPMDDSKRSLAPFFSRPVVSATLWSLVIVGALAMLSWPREPLFFHIGTGKGPLLFFQAFSATLILQTYLNLRCGRGELIEPDFTRAYQKEESVQEKEKNFLRYGLIVCLVHTLFILFPFLPILVPAAGVSGLSPGEFLQALSVLFAAALLGRLFGFFAYLLWGRLSVAGYLLIRGFAGFYLFATIGLAPAFNPIRMLYALNQRAPQSMSYLHFTAASCVLMLVLVLVSTWMVNRHIRKEKNR